MIIKYNNNNNENAIFNKCQVEIKKLNEKIENVEKTTQDLILNIQALVEIIKNIKKNKDISEIEEHFDYAIHTDTATAFKYIKHKTSESNINYFRVTKIETGYLRMEGEDWIHYDRNIYVEDVLYRASLYTEEYLYCASLYTEE